MNDENRPLTKYLQDYQAPDFIIQTIDLEFNLDDSCTQVKSVMQVLKRDDSIDSVLVLNGEELVLDSISINDCVISEDQFEEGINELKLFNLPKQFTLEINNTINPAQNTALDGLYKSGNIFCTQNEPEGFRRITYFIDRPDIMAKYTTKIIADQEKYPFLLSNGNEIGRGNLANGKHWVKWEDPFAKPSYLYALVAGDFDVVESSYTTKSGNDVLLKIFSDKGSGSKCEHALNSLKKSMQWDEEVYGLEYDLSTYMIVAVDSFNMGAMENKGLNIFNSSCVLADKKMATDHDFFKIESIIGHEYFHNWSGNRVTCRDWFQLTLKEGLTVFRDQEFSADLNDRAVCRINDVNALRSSQFVEDEGPLAHPIRPASYIEINNFYTVTVYEKGAEVIRMIQTLLGKDGFSNGIDKYFAMFDGQAVTTDDFLQAMKIANNDYDFSNFKNWYSQGGTPLVDASWQIDEDQNVLTLKLVQRRPQTTLDTTQYKPFVIPLRLGIVAADGKDCSLELVEDDVKMEGDLYIFETWEKTFSFKNIDKSSVLSLNRGFSSPIKLNIEYNLDQLAFLMGNDADDFNRYEASRLLGKKVFLRNLDLLNNGDELSIPDWFLHAYAKILADKKITNEFKAMCLRFSSENDFHQYQTVIDYKQTSCVRNFMVQTIGLKFFEELLTIYNSLKDKAASTAINSGDRSLKNICLAYLNATLDPGALELVKDQFIVADCMTDELTALGIIIRNAPYKIKEEAKQTFYQKWKHDSLVMQKWIGIIASSEQKDALAEVLKLEKSDVYDKTVPNLLRSLLGSFAVNYAEFHRADGKAYAYFIDKIIETDKFNPQMAALLCGTFRNLSKTKVTQQQMITKHLAKILDESKTISKNLYEVASKIVKI